MRTATQKIERFTIYFSPNELGNVYDFLGERDAIIIDRVPVAYEGDMEKVIEYRIIAERIISK